MAKLESELKLVINAIMLEHDSTAGPRNKTKKRPVFVYIFKKLNFCMPTKKPKYIRDSNNVATENIIFKILICFLSWVLTSMSKDAMLKTNIKMP